jgi:putative effector of murein hydrolase LrgA (UPF0299 family)
MVKVERWAQAGRWFMVAWVLFFIPPAVAILASGLEPAQEGAAFGVAAYCGVWTWIWLRAVGGRVGRNDRAGERSRLASP